MSEERLFLFMSDLASSPPLEVTRVLYDSWRRKAARAVAARALQQGAGDVGGAVPGLLIRLAAEEAKVAMVAERQEDRARADGLGALAAEENREKKARRDLMTSLGYKPFKVAALIAAEPETEKAEIESMLLKHIELRLLALSLRALQSVCYPLMQHVAAAVAARQQKAGASKQNTRKHKADDMSSSPSTSASQ